MTMFVWKSEMLINFRQGYIVAMAETLEEAKNLVRSRSIPWMIRNMFYNELLDEDDIKRFYTLRETLEKDLARECIETDDVLFFEGSE